MAMAKPREMLPQSVRFEVFRRDDFTCRYCGRSSPEVTLHVDHVHPFSEGGSDDLDNLVSACRECNTSKSAKLGIKPPPFPTTLKDSAMSSHPLIGLYGHTLTADGEYQYQFKILGTINANHTLFAVGFYSWDDARDTNVGFLELVDLISETKCALYVSHREWQFRGRNPNYQRKVRHKRARGEETFCKPGTGQYYNTPEEMSERIKRDDEQRKDALQHGRSPYPW